jgi:hypothetical protein
MDLPKSFLHAALCRRKVDLASPYPNFYHKFLLTLISRQTGKVPSSKSTSEVTALLRDVDYFRLTSRRNPDYLDFVVSAIACFRQPSTAKEIEGTF